MEAEKIQWLIHAIDRLKVAITNLVTSSAQFEESAQTITGLTMTLPNTPTFVFGVYLNGQRLTKTSDYTVTTVTVTFAEALVADRVTVVYKY